MKTVLTICCLMVLIPIQANADLTKLSLSPSDLKIVNSYIKTKERTRSDADVVPNRTEYQDAREYIQGDINGDKIPDLIVLYSLEEGSNWKLYVAVFEKPSMRFIADTRVGGKGYRGVVLDRVADGKIEMNIDLYSPYDAMCCPSVKGTAYYSVKENSLTEESLIVDCTGWKPSERPTR